MKITSTLFFRANRDRAMKAKGYMKKLYRHAFSGVDIYVYTKNGHVTDGWRVTLFDSQGNMKPDKVGGY